MKVLHINNYDLQGGAETVFQITSNIREVHNFKGYVNLFNSSQGPDISFHNWANDNKLLGTLNYIFSLRNYKLLRVFLDKSEVDVIHLHGFLSALSPSVLLAIKKAKGKRRLKVVQTLHDFHLVCPNSSLYNFKQNKICEKCVGKKTKLSIFVNNCDRRGFTYSIIKGIRSIIANNVLGHKKIIDTFICPSEFLKSNLIEDGIDENRISVVRNPITNFGQSYPNKKQNIVCFFGRFSKEKNIEFLISAFSLWKEKKESDFRLLLIGQGEEEAHIKKIAKSSSARDYIDIKKYMPFEKLIEEIGLTKYFSMATTCYENAPMSIIEALSQGTIPIVPSIGGMKESVELIKGIGKTYLSNNTESWMSAIKEAELEYDRLMETLRKNKKEIIEMFGLQTYYKKILDIYNY